MRYLQVNASDGSVWTVPAQVIANDAAMYYVENDPDTTYEEEFTRYMDDGDALIDWAINNMNPEDFGASPRMIKPPSHAVGFEELWREAGSDSMVVKDYELAGA